MATITERIDTRSISRDANGQAAGSRTFTVLGAQSAAAARIAFNDLADARTHPDDPALVFDRMDIAGTNGNTVYVVRASYSTFKGGRRQQDPTQAPPVPFFGWEYAKETVKVPLGYQVRITTTAGDLSDTKLVWTAVAQDVTERRIRRTLKVSYSTPNSATLDVIAEQDRKIHRIRGVQYLFLGANVQQDPTDQTAYVISYSWELDKGTVIVPTDSTLIAFPDSPLPDPGTVGRKMFILAPASAVVLPSGAVRLRKPYHTLDLVAAEDPTRIPRAVELLTYEESDTGWQTLPGMVPL